MMCFVIKSSAENFNCFQIKSMKDELSCGILQSLGSNRERGIFSFCQGGYLVGGAGG